MYKKLEFVRTNIPWKVRHQWRHLILSNVGQICKIWKKNIWPIVIFANSSQLIRLQILVKNKHTLKSSTSMTLLASSPVRMPARFRFTLSSTLFPALFNASTATLWLTLTTFTSFTDKIISLTRSLKFEINYLWILKYVLHNFEFLDFSHVILTLNIFESGPKPTPWKYLLKRGTFLETSYELK